MRNLGAGGHRDGARRQVPRAVGGPCGQRGAPHRRAPGGGRVILDEMVSLLDMVRAARVELVDDSSDGARRGMKLLRQAEDYASELPLRVMEHPATLQTVTTVRTELGTCLLAADQLADAGVAHALVIDVLRRGAGLAERTLMVAVLGPERVGA